MSISVLLGGGELGAVTFYLQKEIILVECCGDYGIKSVRHNSKIKIQCISCEDFYITKYCLM